MESKDCSHTTGGWCCFCVWNYCVEKFGLDDERWSSRCEHKPDGVCRRCLKRILSPNTKAKKQPKKKKKKSPMDRKMVCSDCGEVQIVKKIELIRAARVRCQKCGGPLNYPSQV